MNVKEDLTKESHGSREESREKLIRSALKLFAAKGIDGTTIRDIADDAGVNLSMVSYYFQGKEGLYRECIEAFGKSRSEVARSLTSKVPESYEDFRVRLELIIEEMVNYQLENPHPCQIIMAEIDQGLPRAKDIFENTILKTFGMMVQFIAVAKEKKIVGEHVDPLAAAIFIQGAVFHLGRTESIRKEFFKQSLLDTETRKHFIEQLLNLFLKGITVGAKS